MKNNYPEEIQLDIEEKAIKRTKKKRINMKITGKQIKNLQRLIISGKTKLGSDGNNKHKGK